MKSYCAWQRLRLGSLANHRPLTEIVICCSAAALNLGWKSMSCYMQLPML